MKMINDGTNGMQKIYEEIWGGKQVFQPKPRIDNTIAKHGPHNTDFELQKAGSALSVLDPDPYHNWVKYGIALKRYGEANCCLDESRAVWDTFSARSDKFDEGQQETAWAGFDVTSDRPGQRSLTIASIFFDAMQLGWNAERIEQKPFSSSLAEIVMHESLRKIKAQDRYRNIANVTVEHLIKYGQFYFNTERAEHAGTFYFDANTRTLYPLESDRYVSMLSRWSGINRAQPAFKYIQSAVLDEALTGCTKAIVPSQYWAAKNGCIYISNGDQQLVRIKAGSYELLDNGVDDVLFTAGNTLEPWNLVEPVNPFTTCKLFCNAKFQDSYALDLISTWAISLPTDQRCKPPLANVGPVGSGKTRVAVGISELYGMPSRILIPEESGADDFWVSCSAGGLITIDNVDSHIKWLPDALAMAATDGSREKRKLYTDAATMQLKAKAWTCVTSANPLFARDPGLADRLLVVRMKRRSGDTAESELSRDIAEHRDAGLSFIAETLSKALADKEPTAKGLNKRHPDFADFAVRIGRAIGREQEMIKALTSAESDKHLFNLEQNDVGMGLLDLMSNGGTFDGTASELLDLLKEHDGYFRNEKWTSKRLAKRLQALWPHLSELYDTDSNKGRGGIMRYHIEPRNGGLVGLEGANCINLSSNNNYNSLYKSTSTKPPTHQQPITDHAEYQG